MMRQRYYLALDNAQTVNVRAESAARAIMVALRRNRGRRVIRCWTGGLVDSECPHFAARMDYDVPAHEPIPASYGRDPEPINGELFPDLYNDNEKEDLK